MTYPEDFIRQVKRNFPREEKLHKYLDSGQCAAVGNFLASQAKMRFSVQKAVDLFTENRENEVLLELQRMREAELLYEKWQQLLNHPSKTY